MTSYEPLEPLEPLIPEKEEAKATDLGKTFKQLKHKKLFQEVVAAARVCGAIEELCSVVHA